MENSKVINNKASRFLIWSTYILIIFEMLYMSTPFAAFLYSIYGGPLKFLGQHSSTVWLTQNILPHFAQTESILINALLYISWPLMGVGFLIFVIGFCQVYWGKFRRTGPVSGGLYRFVRHPQYTAWAIFGLGMAIFWSRMIVWLMYVTMLFVYYLLAISEEKECIKKYGESYMSYLIKTGRFFPRIWNRADKRRRTDETLPRKSVSAAAIILFYVIAMLGTAYLGFYARSYALSEISMIYEKDTAIVSLVTMDREAMSNISAIALNDTTIREKLAKLAKPPFTRFLVYLMPADWYIPELAMEEEGGYEHRHDLNPTNHGNPATTDNTRYKILISRADVDERVRGKEIFSKARAQNPLLIVMVDSKEKSILSVKRPPLHGKYGDLPVPLF